MKDVLTIIGTQRVTREYANFDESDERDYFVFNTSASRKWPEYNYLCVKLGIPEWRNLTETERAKAVNKHPKKKLLNELYKDDGYSVIQIHKPNEFKWRNNPSDPRDDMPGEKHWEWLQKKHPFKIYMIEAYDDVPSAVKYPFDEAYNLIEPYLGVKLFRSSIDYVMALGILKGYKTIELVGIELASQTEYDYQKPSCYFWTGFAAGKGIKIVTLDWSALFSGLLYGYEDDIMINKSKFEMRLRELQKEELESRKITAGFIAQMDELREAGHFTEYAEIIPKYEEAIHQHGVVAGQLAENQNYLAMCDDMIQSVSKAAAEKRAKDNYG